MINRHTQGSQNTAMADAKINPGRGEQKAAIRGKIYKAITEFKLKAMAVQELTYHPSKRGVRGHQKSGSTSDATCRCSHIHGSVQTTPVSTTTMVLGFRRTKSER